MSFESTTKSMRSGAAKIFLTAILGLALILPMSASGQTVICELLANGRTTSYTVPVGTTVDWAVNSSPSDLPYYWHVTEDGVVIWNDEPGIGLGRTNRVQTYTYITPAYYEVYFHAEQNSNHGACQGGKSNTILFTVTSQTTGPGDISQAGCPPDKICLHNFLSTIGVDSPGQLVVAVAAGFASIVALGAVIFLVFSGFKLMIATSEEAITSAKTSVIWSVGGFAVAVLAFTIVSGASRLLGFDPLLPGNTIRGNGFISIPGGDPGDFSSVATYLMNGILGLTGVVAVLMIIYYGYRYTVAAGNEESIAAAKNGLKWAIVGFIIVVMAFTIISIVQRLLFFGAPA